MKYSLVILMALVASFCLTACGLTEEPEGGPAGNDAGTVATTDGGTVNPGTDAGTVTPADLAAPFKSSGQNRLEVSRDYVANSACAEIVGNLPGMTWSTGLIANEQIDGNYLRSVYAMAAGTYDLSYRVIACNGSSRSSWASYGDPAKLARMSVEARRFVQCNWYDSANSRCLSVSTPSCDLRITVDSAGNITPAGNMGNFSQSNSGC